MVASNKAELRDLLVALNELGSDLPYAYYCKRCEGYYIPTELKQPGNVCPVHNGPTVPFSSFGEIQCDKAPFDGDPNDNRVVVEIKRRPS